MTITANCSDCGRLDLIDVLDEDLRCPDCLHPDMVEEIRIKREQIVFDRVAKSGLPRPLRTLRLPDTEVGEVAREWARGDHQVMVLTGQPGRGKTWLAAAAATEAFKYRSVRWVAAGLRVGQVDAAFGDRDRADALSVLNGNDSIVLDDLDKACDYEKQVSRIFTTIDARIAAGSPILITMNATPGQLGRLVDSRDKHGRARGMAMASRLNSGQVIELTGPDRRRPS